ncbi:SufE family protein [Antribacter gilvus]|uniref:SufE family protein n=1 Tax=Antribacter gilvus TaxID=2304675 RepID=UPI000F7A57CF|nr:SufE family protein [Antribacter gilvus]
MSTSTIPLPEALAELRDAFLDTPEKERLQLLLEVSRELPPLPARYADAPERLERVQECQSPVYAIAEVSDDGLVAFHASAPEEAPTTRGFASILAQGLTGLTAQQVLDLPDELPLMFGLTRSVSLLRLNGMAGMLTRAKRQVREQLAARTV